MSRAFNIQTKLGALLRSRLRRNNAYGSHVNTPIQFTSQDWHVNERIVELPFVYGQFEANGKGRQVLEFGCSHSLLPMQLAALGYTVTGIDLRSYPFTHPNFTFHQGNILDFPQSEAFDFITSVSVIEHIGLGAYLEEKREDDLERVILKLCSLLKPLGKLIITTPIGKAHANEFYRSFTYEEVVELFTRHKMGLEKEQFYCRSAAKIWLPCEQSEIAHVSNHIDDRGPTGVNGVGCFVWHRTVK